MHTGNLNKIIPLAQKDLEESEVAVYHSTAANSRFRDIESSVSIRDQFTREDYEYFRENEILPTRKKNIIKAARKAYEKIGIIRNVIDLMGDFTCQGISIIHAQPSVEKFYKAWFNKVNGRERSERFANLLYREANVIVKRDTGKLKPSQIKQLKSAFAAEAQAADIKWDMIDVEKRDIPLRYTFMSPVSVEVVGAELAHFMGDLKYYIKLSPAIARIVKQPKNDMEKDLVTKLPQYIMEAIKNNNILLLDSSKTKVYHYKKDDWDLWATPMIYPIMDDLVLLEKLKLADTAALDGAISYIRIWKLGSLQTAQPMLPSKSAINKLRNILLNNVGGGSMDLVWGPELTLEETSTDMSKFLGIEKYEPAMTAIYEGLGIPSTLTGKNSSGFNNNAIQMKTLIERLNYGRMILTQFWEEEIRVVQQAMGFASPAKIQYDHMTLTDESAWLALLIQLVDRNIVSEDYVRDKFSESAIEKIKVKREWNEHNDGPPKVSPFHNPNLDSELKKIALQNGYAPSEVGLELDEKKSGEISKIELDKTKIGTTKPKGEPGEGRPTNSFDTSPRKQRQPKVSGASEDAMKTFIWAQKAYNDIAELVLPAVLSSFGCKNVRSMTDAQFKEYERIKFAILCGLTPQEQYTTASLVAVMSAQPKVSQHVNTVYNSLVDDLKEPTIDMLRNAQILAYAVTE